MAISPDLIRGHTDNIILRFLYDHDSYGYEINRNIHIMTEGEYELSEATLYTAFRRLEKKAVLNPIGGMKTVGQEGDTIVLQKKEKRNMMII